MLEKYCVKKPYTVFVGIAVILLLGIISFTKMSTDLLPSMNLPYVIVYTTYPGASPEEVETVVTKPLEASFATAGGLSDISSQSKENVSIIIMEFESDTDMNTAMLDLNGKIDLVAPNWSDSVGTPVLMKINPDMLPVMVTAVDIEGMDIVELSEFVEDKLIPQIEGIDGVGSVSASGLIEEDITITLEQSLVDELNSRILREIDSELADVEQELIDAENELDDAETQLDKKGKAGLKKINDALKQVQDGKASIETALTQCRAQLSDLQDKRSQAKSGLDAINSTLSQIPESMTSEQNQALSSMREQLSALKKQRSDKKAELQSLKDAGETEQEEEPAEEEPEQEEEPTQEEEPAQEEEPEQQEEPAQEEEPEQQEEPEKEEESEQQEEPEKEEEPEKQEDPEQQEEKSVENSILCALFPTAHAEGNAEKITQLEQEIKELDSQIASIENSSEYKSLVTLEESVASRSSLEAQKTELEGSISQLDSGIAQLEGVIAKLEKGIIPGGMVEGIDEDLDTEATEKQLKDAKKQAKSALNEAGDQIYDGKTQLQEARKEFEEKRDEAFEKADIGGVITLTMLSQILAAQNFEMPAGYVAGDDDSEILIRVGKKFEEIDALKNMLLFEMDLDTVPEVRLGDVATVEITDNSDTTFARLNKNPGIMLTIEKQSTASTAELSDSLQAEFDVLSAQYEGLRLTPLFDQGIYIDMVVDSVLENLLYGAALAILVLLLFLGDFRPTLIVGLSIPVSVIAAFVLMYFTNITINVMSLAGLALGVGMLVDNSIVVIENIYRLRNEGMPLFKACVQGTKQMSGAIFSSTLTTVCVFLPIVFVTGIARDLFSDMGLTITYSLMASLLVALTVVPALSSFMLRKTKPKKEHIFTWVQNAYSKLLSHVLKKKFLTLLLAVALLAFTASKVMQMGTSFMPEVNSTQMTAALTLDANVQFDEMVDTAEKVLDKFLTVEEIDTIGVFSGSSSLTSMTSSDNGTSLTYYITLQEDKARPNTEIAESMKEAVAPLGVDVSVATSTMDISMLTGSGISVGVRGNDTETLRKAASEIAEIMRTVEGLTDISDGQEKTTQQITLVVDKEKAVKNNLTVAQVYAYIATTLADGQEITTMNVSDKNYSVITVDAENQKLTTEGLLDCTISTTDSEGETLKVRIGDICEIESSDSLATINRESQQRVVTASASIADGYNSGLVGRELDEKLAKYTPPEGTTLVESGENDTVNEIMGDLVLMILIAVALIYGIMVAQFQSLLLPFIVLFTIPLAFTGGLLGLLITDMDISVVALIGFLVLSGVIVNNGIVFVDSVNQMRLEGMEKRQALIETGRTRLRPILMTALTTILGMLTMAMGTGMGAEMMQPMAIVTIGGLSYATLMTLFVVPALYDIFTGKHPVRGAKTAEKALE